MECEEQGARKLFSGAKDPLAQPTRKPHRYPRALETLFLRCVRAPQLVGRATVSTIQHTLGTPGLDVSVYNSCLDALGAIIYSRPALVTKSMLDSVKVILCKPGIPRMTHQRACEVLKFSLATPAAPSAMATLEDLLLQPGLEPSLYAFLIQALLYAASWRMDLIRLERVLEIAAAEHLAEHQDLLLGPVIGRLMYVALDTFSSASLHRLQALYSSHP